VVPLTVYAQVIAGKTEYDTRVWTLEDKHSSFTINDVSGPLAEQFRLSEKREPNFGYTKSAFWIRVELDEGAISLDPNQMLLEIAYPHLDSIKLYLPLDEQLSQWHEITGGDLLPFQNREKNYRFFNFNLSKMSSDASFFFIRIQNESSVKAPITIYPLESFYEKVATDQMALGAYYGMMAVMIIYNFFIFLSVRDPSYFYYVVYVSAFMLFQLTYGGLGYQYLWPNSPSIQLHSIPITILGFLTSAFAFTRVFLSTKEKLKRCDLYLRSCLAVFAVVFLLALFLPYSLMLRITVSVAAVSLTPLIFIGIYAWYKKIKTGKYYALAFAPVMISGIATILDALSVIPQMAITEYSLHVGSMIEVIVLSFGLANRIKREQDEKIAAQEEVVVANNQLISAKESALKNLEKYQKVYENSLQGLFTVSENGYFTNCNNSFASMLAIDDKASLLDVDKKRVNFVDFFPDVPQIIKENKDLSKWRSFTVQGTRFDGTTFMGSLTASRVIDEETKDTYYECSIEDITQALEIEKVKQEKREVEAATKARTQFFASMSHEFRTPLTAILGYTELAEQTAATDKDRVGYISTIHRSAQHMLQLINDVLDLSKIEAQKLDVELIPIDTIALMNEIKDFVWILADQKSINFDIRYQFPIPSIFVSDPTRLKQALINLCSNAIKFTNEGGVSITVSCDESQEMLCFAVKDTGIGLKPEQLETLFEAFTQADKSTSRNFGGTGLGLYLSKLIANKLGGDIVVTSEYQKGSTFTVSVSIGDRKEATWLDHLPEVPRSNESVEDVVTEPLQAHENEPDKEESEKQLKVMLAEDNAVNQQLIGFHLKKAGVDVVYANDGLEAIAQGLTNEFDLILMDMNMPNMDGLVAVTHLREKDIATPIYALTGNVDDASMEECRNAGCDGHLAKPFDRSKLDLILQGLRQS